MKDERALALLRKMSDRLAGAKTFTFKARTSREVLVGDGVQATVFDDLRVAVQRPDKVAATRTGDLPAFRFAYDGKAMTVYAAGTKQWATTSAPPSIEAMVFAAHEQGGLNFAADEVLVADPLGAMTKDLTRVAWVGQTTIAGRKTDHLVLASRSLDLQYRLDVETSLPVESAIVYVDDPRKPHFYIEYLDWQLDPKLPSSTFTLPRPPGATKVDFRAAVSAAQ